MQTDKETFEKQIKGLLKLAKEKIKFVNCIKIVEETKMRLKQNANYDMSIDNMLFNMWGEVN